MPPAPRSNARLKRLGSALRELRNDADLTADEAARTLGWSGSKVSRIETGTRPASPEDIRALVGVYGVEGEEAERYAAVARRARQRDWWHRYDDVLPEKFDSYLGLESEASRISTFEASLVPGLLQTERYAAAVLDLFPLRGTPDERDRAIALRMRRQARLAEEPLLELDAIIAETVIRQTLGGPDVTREQLQHLLDVASRPNVTLRLLPFGADHPGVNGPFSIVEFPDPEDGRIVCVDALTSTLYIEQLREVGIYRMAMDSIRDGSIDPQQTVDALTERVKELHT